MKICLYTPNFLPATGGAERAADRIVRGLIAKGHTVTVLCQAQGPFPNTPYPVRRYRRPPAMHLYPGLIAHAIKKAHKAWKFQVMIAFYAYPTGYAASKVKDKLDFKLIISPRGGDLYPNFHALKKRGVLKTIQRGYQRADRIVAISRWINKRLTQVCGQNLPPIVMAPNGIDLQQHQKDLSATRHIPKPTFAQELRLEKQKFILHLARVCPVKQQDIAVQAVKLKQQLFRQQKLQYIIAGDGQSLPQIQNMISQYALQDIIKTVGVKKGPDKFWLLDNALLMVSSSREEGMPNVVLEAMASTLPILASDIDPHLELIQDKGWGLFFKDQNPQNMADQLQRIITHDLTPYRHAAKQLAPTYSLKKMINHFEQACVDVLNQKKT